jgi:tripartite-type tricarboxylate transporter receptor subunit TctC
VKTIAVTLASLGLAASALAQPYPTRPIRLVVPFPPGGTVDISARAIAPGVGELLGQNVIVENRGGAAGVIGTDLVAKAAPNGYTLLMGSNSTFSVAPAVNPNTPYNPVRDFAPITLVGATPFALVVHPSVPAKMVKELIALARPKPGHLTMGSGGAGHLVGELFQSTTAVKFTHVPYQGAGPAGIALMGGQIDLMFDQLTTSIGPVRAGRTRALAVSSQRRSALLPDVPTMVEAGVAGFVVTSVTGVLAPAGTPAEIVNRINAAVHKVLALPATKERFAGIALETAPSTPGELAAYVREDLARWTRVVKDAGIKPD